MAFVSDIPAFPDCLSNPMHDALLCSTVYFVCILKNGVG